MSRINHQPIFLLSSRPWRENSLRVDAYSRDYGRIALLARSARTRGSELRGILVPFVPISASWFGKEELKTLHRAEWLGGWPQPQNRQLLSALYLNELLLNMTVAEDPNPALYDDFQHAHRALAQDPNPTLALRHFEWQLLKHLGLAPDVEYDEQGQTIDTQAHYFIQPNHAAQKVAVDYQQVTGLTVSGCLLQQLAQQQLTPQSALGQALALNRLLLNHYLPQNLTSRQIWQQLSEFKQHFQAA